MEVVMNTEKRLKHALYMLMSFPIHRYLMSNTAGRLDGSEKASVHLRLTNIYVASRMGIVDADGATRVTAGDKTHDDGWVEHGTMVYTYIHDATQKLTDYMDEVIGFPLEDKRPDYDTLAPKFFEEFIRLADLEWDKIVAERGITPLRERHYRGMYR
jgi:hypothetical protein